MRYRVTVNRVEYYQAVVEVEADNEEDAAEEGNCCDGQCFEIMNANQSVELVEAIPEAQPCDRPSK